MTAIGDYSDDGNAANNNGSCDTGDFCAPLKILANCGNDWKAADNNGAGDRGEFCAPLKILVVKTIVVTIG